MTRIVLLMMLFPVLFACGRGKAFIPELEDILEENLRLQQVLDHYENDSLKYRAAIFLIRNLPFHGTNNYSGMEIKMKLHEMHGTGKYTPQQVIDSIIGSYGSIHTPYTEHISDVYISPEYLIDNIEQAFRVWKEQPWGKNVSFELFCEYVLPYRVGDEKLVSWRNEIYEKYNSLLDDIRDMPEAEDPYFVSKVLFDSLRRMPVYFTELFESGPHVGPKIVEWKSGSCKDLTDLLLYVYRALGLPCAKDIMLMRGNRNAPHYWNSMFDKNGKSYYFTLLDNMVEPGNPEDYWDPKGKVYRETFSLNRRMIDSIEADPGDLYPTFRYPCMVDVTSVYAGKKSHTVKIPDKRLYSFVHENDILYLCSACRMNWIPLAWCRVKNGEAVFGNVEGLVVFRLATYMDGRLIPCSDPFSLDRQSGEICFLSPDVEKEKVTLFHKFPLYFDGVSGRVIDGVFEGSNDRQFEKVDTLFQIKYRPVRLFTSIDLYGTEAYRYVRYKGKPGSHCDIAEIYFYDAVSGEIPLKGKIIGTSSNDPIHDYTKAFDNDPYTSFDYHEADGGWTGLDLQRPHVIRRIVFTPRNRDDYIRKGDQYELFYCDRDWKSAGIVVAGADSLVYEVPSGCLLYLKNHTRGKDERIFEYRDGNQCFW